MSNTSTDNDVAEITIGLRGLRITVCGPSAQAAQLVAEIAQLGARTSSRSVEPSSPGSFSLVDQDQQSGPSSAARETRRQIEDSFGPCPGFWLTQGSRLGGAREFVERRIRRAYRAGQWAGAVLEGRCGFPNRSEQLQLRPRYYVVLRAENLLRPTVVTSSAEYFAVVGRLQDSGSLSHSFPSETEARAYCAGAGVEYPVVQQ